MPESKAVENSASQDVRGLWTALAPYLSGDMVQLIVSANKLRLPLEDRKQVVTVLFADIRGFARIAELLEPEECVEILNAYLAIGVDAVLEFEGTVDKFQGDCLMAIFTGENDHEDHGLRAVSCALRLRDQVQHLEIPQLAVKHLRIGIGISTGIAVLGSVGCDKRMDYTAIGDVVNVAHRLQAMSSAGQIIISQDTRCRIADEIEVKSLGSLQLRGRRLPVDAYSVNSFSSVLVGRKQYAVECL